MIEETNLPADPAVLSNTVKSNPVREKLLYLAWGQALIATSGSLFLSEVMGFVPCILCWYQRILMYPLVIIIGVGVLLRDVKVRYYALPLSLLGMVIGLYHNLLYYGAIPEQLHVCTSGVPCETRWIEWFGFIGIPFAAFTAFTVITLAVIWYKPFDEDDDEQIADAAQVRNETALKWVSVALMIAYAGTVVTALASRVIENARLTDNVSETTAGELTIAATDEPSILSETPYPENFVMTGQQVYLRQCSACHGQNAQGIANLGTSLINNPFIQERTDAEMLRFIKTGRLPSDPQNQTGLTMPAKGGNPALTDTEILAVTAYLRSL